MTLILIVDSDEAARAARRKLIESFGYMVCGEAANAEQAVTLSASLNPDVIVVEVDPMGGPGSLEEARMLGEAVHAGVLYASVPSSRALISDIVGTGPYGYLSIPYNAHDLYAAIEATAVRRELELERRALREALETLGHNEIVERIAGGIAHDFNNLFAVIQGNTELIAEGTNTWRHELTAILRATARGVEVTNWLLSYSRQQNLNPKAIDLKAFVDGSGRMLARIIPESVDISIVHGSASSVVFIDESQLQTALLNLAFNARDAMASSGELSITTGTRNFPAGKVTGSRKLAPGEYGFISVADSGSGIDPITLLKVREPYFTTKEVGQGSGLGLSMVDGFATQSGGCLEIESKHGRGSVVTMYIPLATATAVESAVPRRHDSIPLGSSEKVFLIEDDPDVNEFLVKMIEGLGYRIASVANGDEALARIEDLMAVDVVLSDVALPGKYNGPELIEKIREKNPAIKTVLISGYPGVIPLSGVLPGHANSFMSKPFSRRKLAEMLYDVLHKSRD